MPAVALTFHGPTNYPASKNFRNAVCVFGNGLPNAAHGGTVFDELYLLMSSEGGSIEDAISMYHLLEMLRVKVITVNMGQIASAAMLPFVSGRERWASDTSYFHLHNLSWTYDRPQTLHHIQMVDHANIIDKERELYRAILKENTKITDADFDTLKLFDQPSVHDASFAEEKGIIDHIGLPVLPAGTPILNIDY